VVKVPKIRGGERYIQVWAPDIDNGRVPIPSITTMWGGGTLWTINWRWGNGVPLRPITLSLAYIQGGSKKVSCCTVSTAYFFWATLYILCFNPLVIRSRTWAFGWYRNWWPWMTLNGIMTVCVITLKALDLHNVI